MSSEAITRNDLTNILNEVLPPTPSEYKKLLWTNPSPTSVFAAQTVSLDLSDYDDVEIEMAGAGTFLDTTTQCFKLVVGIGGLLSISANYIWWRYVTPRTTGVEFGAGYRTTTYASSATADNNQMIPIRIYGIKYERVLPPAMDALEWKLAGTATGNNTVAMPTDYNEIMLVATGYSTYFFTAIVPKSEISSSNIAPRFASYYNASNNAGGYWLVNSSTASLGSYQENGGNNVLSQATFKLYYR